MNKTVSPHVLNSVRATISPYIQPVNLTQFVQHNGLMQRDIFLERVCSNADMHLKLRLAETSFSAGLIDYLSSQPSG
jgi:hypothetical protein